MVIERAHPLGQRWLWLGCALLAAAAHAAPLAAQSSAAERETARALMQEGDRLRAAGDMRGAMARFESAHALMHVPTTGLELARVQAQLGLLVEARSTASEVMHLQEAAGEPRVFGEARREAVLLANALENQVPSLKTMVEPSDADYTLSIDGATVPAQARGVAYRANPGSHSVRVEAAGYAALNRQVTLVEGQSQTITVRLTPLAPIVPSSAVAGPERSAPFATSAASSGSGDDSGSDPGAGGRVRGIIGLSVGGAALVAGGVAGAHSLVKTNHERERCDDHTRCDASALSSANTLANVANVAIPLGVIGIAYGLYELLTLPSARNERAQRHGLQLSIHDTSLVLRGEL
jgi:hypothetical protein